MGIDKSRTVSVHEAIDTNRTSEPWVGRVPTVVERTFGNRIDAAQKGRLPYPSVALLIKSTRHPTDYSDDGATHELLGEERQLD